ncbi:YfhO family protein [Candidatus Sumerlaeota bacterium]|nr:YfhO family protein [Candidatus Sumerlaeota bacterium]
MADPVLSSSSASSQTPRPLSRGRVFETGLPVLVLLAVPFILNLGDLAHGRVPWFMDIVAYFYPLRLHAGRLLASGEMPFWNRTIFGGAPLLSNLQCGLLYPGNWSMLAWPGPRSFLVVNVAHVVLLGVGVFLWTRRLTASSWAACFAGLAVQLGGWSRAHEAFGSYLQVGAWFPWMLWACQVMLTPSPKAATSGLRARRWGIAAGVFGAMQWLGGAPQLALYCSVGLVAYALGGWIVDRRTRFASVALFLVCWAGVSFGLSAPQTMTAPVLLSECGRLGGLTLDHVMQGAQNAREMAQAWIGGTGRPEIAETIVYPGYLVLVLALVGLVAAVARSRRRGHGPFPLALLLLVLLPCLSCWKALVPLWYRVAPFYNCLHGPERSLFVAYVGMAALSAHGFAFVLSGFRRANSSAGTGPMPGSRVGRAATLLSLALILLSTFDLMQFAHRRIDIRTTRVESFELADATASAGIGPGDRFFAHDIGVQYSYNFTRSDFALTLLPNLGALYGLEDIQGYDPFIPWRYGVFMRLVNRTPRPTVTLHPKYFGLVRNIDSPWLRRFGPLKARGPIDFDWPFLPPHRIGPGEGIRFPLSRPFDATPENVSRLSARLGGVVPADEVSRVELDRMECRVEIAFFQGETRIPGLAIAERPDPEETNYLWPDVLPPDHPAATVVPARVTFVQESRETSPTMSSPARADWVEIRNPGPAAVLIYSLGLPRSELDPFRPTEVADTFESVWTDPFPDEVRIHESDTSSRAARSVYEEGLVSSWSPEQVHVEIAPGELRPSVPSRTVKGWKWSEKRSNRLRLALPEDHAGGWVVLSEAFAPGWKCRVDDVRTQIYPADAMFRAVPVEPGAREIEMRYAPPGFAVGMAMFVSCLGLILLAWTTAAETRRAPRGV